MNRSVARNIIVVTHGGESACPVTGDDRFQRKGPVTLRGTAMHHNQVDAPVVLVLRTVQDCIAHISTTGLHTECRRNGGQHGNGDFQNTGPNVGLRRRIFIHRVII